MSRFRVSHITSHKTAGLGPWTDAEIRRVLTQGVGRDVRPLVQQMQRGIYFAKMTDRNQGGSGLQRLRRSRAHSPLAATHQRLSGKPTRPPDARAWSGTLTSLEGSANYGSHSPSVLVLNHFDAGAAILGECAFHQAHADIGVPEAVRRCDIFRRERAGPKC